MDFIGNPHEKGKICGNEGETEEQFITNDKLSCSANNDLDYTSIGIVYVTATAVSPRTFSARVFKNTIDVSVYDKARNRAIKKILSNYINKNHIKYVTLK